MAKRSKQLRNRRATHEAREKWLYGWVFPKSTRLVRPPQ